MNFAFDIQKEMDALKHEVDKSQKVAGGPYGYRLRRIILAHFWLYRLQIFEIPHGRLVLAGDNASGKSTVLTAALPLALEGSLRPERLDTFGGKHKNVEYYVLGDENAATSFKHSKRTSYVALEFEWCLPDAETSQAPDLEVFSLPQHEPQDKERYLTIGVSLYGYEAPTVHIQPLYFIITDGSRLHQDIKLVYVDNNQQIQTYSQHDFKESLKGHGIICETQEKYAREVSQRLFGFGDQGKFRRLIELLLLLRRPNPSDKLTVDTVQEFLTQALPSIPSDIAKEAVETIGEIDNLQQQIEQLDQEYQAVSELHHAQQKSVLSKAQNAGLSYKMSYQTVEQLNVRLADWHHELTDLEAKQQQDNSIYEELHAEKERVIGRISAIEMSDGIKAAQQIVEAHRQVKSSREQVDKQQKSLERAQRRFQNYEENLLLQNKQFQDQFEGRREQMRALSVLMREKALWYEAAEQFQRGAEHLDQIISIEPDVVEIIQGVSQLAKIDTEQRQKWLQKLDQLHQEKRNLELAIERAQLDESHWSRETDRWFIQFKAELGNFSTLSRQIELTLENILTNADDTVTSTLKPANEQIDQGVAHDLEGKTSLEDIDDVNSSVTRCTEGLQQHKTHIDSIVYIRNQTLQRWRQEIDKLNVENGLQSQKISDKEQDYKIKKSQPEILPKQSEHRKIARKKLSERNIPAFPFYSLVDLASESESEEAGCIEYMLEDTGLLDALVILDEDVVQADNLLQAEGLSDCRLDGARLEQLLANNAGKSPRVPVGRWLQFDAAARDLVPTTYQKWESTVNKLIPLIEALWTSPTDPISSNTTFTANANNTSVTWQHGLLTGQSGRGKVRFLGKTARQRARQQELANLEREITILKNSLEELTHRLMEREMRFNKFSAEQDEIRSILERNGLSGILIGLKNISTSLNNTNNHYKNAQEQTRKKRLEYNQLSTKLVEQSGPIVTFTHDHEKVRIALHETHRLEAQTGLLQQGLQALITIYGTIQAHQQHLQDARVDKDAHQAMYRDLQDQLARHESILETLQEIAHSPEAQDLTQKLESLRMRAKQLDDDILTTAKELSAFAERKKSLSAIITQKEAELQTTQVDMRQKQVLFKDLLTVYPVPELQDALALMNEGKYTMAVQQLLLNASTQGRLQQELLDAQSALNTMHQTHMSLLHEYGPDLDKQTLLITFSHANGMPPFELLSLLESNHKRQQELLKMEEIKLFESFLLRRMTEVLHRYIREAKEWVEKINAPLREMTTVHDHYELEWQAKPRPERAKLGSYLAKHQKLFNKPLPKMTEEERDLLRVAFKQEINALWHNHDEGSKSMSFDECLQTVFDYRQWFQFKVYVTPKGGQKTLLTNKALGTRSGAERLFALLVPLLAAVTALYNQAAKGAPRLLALDEAFDRASSSNMKQFIEYLAKQDFQWIMTGPQLNISGTQVPASIRYLLLHEKGRKTATALPRIWQSRQTNTSSLASSTRSAEDDDQTRGTNLSGDVLV